jgi:hypothetical protein
MQMALTPITPVRRRIARSSELLSAPAPFLSSFSLGRSSCGQLLIPVFLLLSVIVFLFPSATYTLDIINYIITIVGLDVHKNSIEIITAETAGNIGKSEVRILIVIHTKKENYMLRIMTVILNLGIVIYLGFQAKACLGTEQIAGINVA